MKRESIAKILVVDDDSRVRRSLTRILTIEGYSVIEAANGGEALELMGAQGADLVFTDVYMPKVDGVELVIRLLDMNPEMKVIAMSGGGYRAKKDLLDDISALGVSATLEKPFSSEDALELVASVLKG